MLDLIMSCHSGNGGGEVDSPSSQSHLTITEVLSKIISHLSLSDRKSARLVCWNWYKAASHNSILKTEKLVCVGDYNRKQVFSTLSKCVHCWPHLQFLGLLVDRASIRFWEKHGDQIHSLEFVNCRFTKKAARSVIRHCGNLKDLNVKNCSGFFSCDLFDYCKKKAIRRSSLESIKIENDADISDYTFKRAFEVFPLVKSMAVSLVNNRHYNVVYKNVYFEQSTKSETPVYESKSIFSHSAVYEKLRSSSDCMRDLKYVEIDNDASHMRNNFLDSVDRVPDLKFRSLFFSPSSFNIPSRSALSTFFARQDKLECLVLEKCHFDNECCSLILDSCVNLRHLELSASHDVDLGDGNYLPIILCQDILEKFVNSKLEVLKLHFDFRFEELEAVPSVENNTALCTLSINSNYVLRKNISTLMEAFQRLKYLDLSNCNLNDALMQTILKCQVNLESLILSYNKDLTDFGLTGKPLKLEHYMTAKDTFSISGLTQLRILDLRECSQITVQSLREMILPELKYLSLQNCRKISFDGFQVLSENCPSLEFLDISQTTISPESLIKLYRQLNRLQFLDITFCTIDELSMQVLLSCSGSLRFVRHTSNQYYYNIFKKQWKSTKTRIRVEVNSDAVEKCYSFNSDPPFTSKIFNCW